MPAVTGFWPCSPLAVCPTMCAAGDSTRPSCAGWAGAKWSVWTWTPACPACWCTTGSSSCWRARDEENPLRTARVRRGFCAVCTIYTGRKIQRMFGDWVRGAVGRPPSRIFSHIPGNTSSAPSGVAECRPAPGCRSLGRKGRSGLPFLQCIRSLQSLTQRIPAGGIKERGQLGTVKNGDHRESLPC